MTVVLISGGLTFIVGILILRPFSVTRDRGRARAQHPHDTRRSELLRQLRDLEDDLAAGKLTQDDHRRLSEPVEREAAAVLAGTSHGQKSAAGLLAPGKPSGSAAADQRSGAAGQRAAGRWRRRVLASLVLAASAAGVAALLVDSASARAPGQTISGDSVPGAPTSAGTQGEGSAPAAQSSRHKSPTAGQLAAVTAAETQVRLHPKSVTAHLALAGAYAAAGASQLAAVEYLAVTRIDPRNAEANSNLALLAFEVGRPDQGKAMVDRVLAADPRYPEALYVRGLINLVGLRRPRAAARDFIAYLAAAPFGSHRTAAATMLALAQSEGHR